MVVDDDADGRFLIEHRLRKAFNDCAVVACAAPSEALAMLRADGFDAIITDNRFGAETGSEFIFQARRRGLVCPILMVTSSEDPNVQRDGYAAGATRIFMAGRGDFTDCLRHLLNRTAVASAMEQAAGE
jgi:CheY-like chemotaxis protein